MAKAFLSMLVLFPLAPALRAAEDAEARQTVIVVVGTPGNEEYAKNFSQWADRWETAVKKAQAKLVRIGDGPEPKDADESSDRAVLEQTFAGLAEAKPAAVWLVLIGHGTFDGKRAKFNLRGPDVTAEDLAEWLGPLSAPVAVVNCASASGPFINRLSGENRVIVTAAKSGYELNYARFGEHLSASIADPDADLDKDGQTSLLEAFLAASAAAQDFYKQEGRLATEHALIDDNGDALGTPADWFRGFRAVRTAKEGAVPDGSRANQFVLVTGKDDERLTARAKKRRDELELEIAGLRSQKPQLAEDDYYRRLEPLLLDLARLYAEAESESAKH